MAGADQLPTASSHEAESKKSALGRTTAVEWGFFEVVAVASDTPECRHHSDSAYFSRPIKPISSMRDLSHPLSPDTPIYPGDPPVRLTPHATHDDDGYRVADIGFGTHAGTHLDAPAHTEPDGRTLDAYPVERFAFDARIVDIDADAGERIVVDEFEAVEDIGDAESDESGSPMILVRTGWDAHWGTDRYHEHPFLTAAAAEWCAARGYDLGLDFASPDAFGDPDLPAHHALLGNGSLIVENLTDLDGLPGRVRLLALPLSFVGVDGSPVRAVADV